MSVVSGGAFLGLGVKVIMIVGKGVKIAIRALQLIT
jgi:hypothetical protein